MIVAWQTAFLASPSASFGGGADRGGGIRRRGVVVMRDRSKNRKPVQRGRYLSIEAIQAVQSLKRAALIDAAADGRAAAAAAEAGLRRLLKADMVAVMRELASQGEARLALQVFEEIRKEHWYKPQLSLYINIIAVLAKSGLNKEVNEVCLCLKRECLEPDTGGFNSLLMVLIESGFTELARDCFRLMKLWDSEPDRTTYRILIRHLEAVGKLDLSKEIRLEAEQDFGEEFDPMEEEDNAVDQIVLY